MQALGISQVLQRPLEPVTGIPLPPAHRETAQVRGTEARKESRGQTGTKQDLARAPCLFLSVCLPCLNLQMALSVTDVVEVFHFCKCVKLKVERHKTFF